MKLKRSLTIFATTFLTASTIGLVTSLPSQAATSPALGASSNFAVLSSAGLVNAGASSIQGDIGMSPTISYTDSGSIATSSGIHFNDASAASAIASANAAYSAAAASTPATPITTDLGTQTLVPGTYAAAAGLNINGTLTLDGQNNPSAVFIFQTPATLATGAASHVTLINGAQACNVFWQVGAIATLGANSDFKGTLLGNAGIGVGSTSSIAGRLFALHGTISLNANSIVKPNCVTPGASVIKPLSPLTGIYLPGVSLTLSSQVLPKSGNAVCAGAVTYSLDKNPLTGASGNYPLASPVVTTNWLLGSYHLIITYPGSLTCAPSTNNSVELKFGATVQSAISGGGSYNLPAGRANFSLSIKSATQAGVSTPAITGKVIWQVKKAWKFQGTLNTLTATNGVNASTGSGSLWYWSSINKGHDGKWVLATTGNALTTVQFTTPAASTKGRSRPISSFAIGFSGAATTGTPSLPVLGSLIPVSGGSDD
ncbi:MAG: ice-binding family protein [Actinomycetes bacterium]